MKDKWDSLDAFTAAHRVRTYVRTTKTLRVGSSGTLTLPSAMREGYEAVRIQVKIRDRQIRITLVERYVSGTDLKRIHGTGAAMISAPSAKALIAWGTQNGLEATKKKTERAMMFPIISFDAEAGIILLSMCPIEGAAK